MKSCSRYLSLEKTMMQLHCINTLKVAICTLRICVFPETQKNINNKNIHINSIIIFYGRFYDKFLYYSITYLT